MDVVLRRRHLAETGHPTGQAVDVGQGEVDAAFVRRGQQVQHGVGRAAHRDVEAHRVLEGGEARDAARQRGRIVLFVPAAGEIDDHAAGLAEQPLAIGMRRQDRSVAGQRQAERLGQAVHRVGGEHARAGTAGRAGGALDRSDFLVAVAVVRGDDHRVYEVDRALGAFHHDLAGLHRAARDEDGRDVEPHRRHQHAGRDLVAIGDAHQRVGAVRIDHVFDAVGDQLAARQRIEHAVMAHRDAVIDGDRVELLGDPARRRDLAGDELPQILQMDMARHELGEAVGDGDDRLAEILVLHARRAPQPACAGLVAAMGRGAGAVCRHRGLR